MINLKNQKGSVLVTALVSVAVLLILFLSAFSYGIGRYSVHVKNQHKIRAQYLAESGINRAIHLLENNTTKIEELHKDSLHVIVEDIGSFTVTCRPYGGYQLFSSMGKSGSQQSKLTAIIGIGNSHYTQYAITLTDENYPLTATGHTKITGDILTGNVHLTTGQIDGRGIYDKQFHVGRHLIDPVASKLKLSTRYLLDYKEYVFQELKDDAHRVTTSLLLNAGDEDFLKENPVVYIEGNLEINGLKFSAKDETVTIMVNGMAEIRGNSRLEGFIEILAGKCILINDSSVISGGVCYGEDSLVLSDDVWFSGQAITETNLIVRDKTYINYPSLLLSLGDIERNQIDHAVTLSTRYPISALCILISEDTLINYPHENIYVDTGSSVRGILCSSDYIDLRGKVIGSVMTRNFWYAQPPTTFINWLRDININHAELDYNPVMPFVIDSISNYGILAMDYRK
ncbi:MAG: hypothetical protein V3V99_01920 [candidate division Zixibacteria bacterium]